MNKSKEIWKPIELFDSNFTHYRVSNKGRVKNTHNWRILKPFDNGKGRLYVQLSNGTFFKSIGISRLVARTFIGDAKELTINHIDKDKYNNNLENLEYITNLANQMHSADKHEYKGKLYTIRELYEIFKPEGPLDSFRLRIQRQGWDAVTAMTTPLRWRR